MKSKDKRGTQTNRDKLKRGTNRAWGPDRRTEGNTEVAKWKPGGRSMTEGGQRVRGVLECRKVWDGTGGRRSEWAGRVSGPASWRLGYSDRQGLEYGMDWRDRGVQRWGPSGKAGQEESCWPRAHRGQMAAMAECPNSRGWLPGPSIGLAEEAGSQSGHEARPGCIGLGPGSIRY